MNDFVHACLSTNLINFIAYLAAFATFIAGSSSMADQAANAVGKNTILYWQLIPTSYELLCDFRHIDVVPLFVQRNMCLLAAHLCISGLVCVRCAHSLTSLSSNRHFPAAQCASNAAAGKQTVLTTATTNNSKLLLAFQAMRCVCRWCKTGRSYDLFVLVAVMKRILQPFAK